MTVKHLKRHLPKQELLRWFPLVAALAAVIVLVAVSSKISAASATFSFSPSSGSYQVGDTLTVTIYENSGTSSALVAQGDFSYPQTLLQYQSTDVSNSAFGVSTPSNSGNGLVEIGRGNTTALTGNQVLASVSFKVLAAGTAALNFSPVCQGTNGTNCIVVSSDGLTNIASASTGATFTLNNPVTITPTCPSGTTGTYPNCVTPTPPPPASTTPTPKTTTTTSTTTHSNSYTPPNSTQPIPVANNGQVQVSQPVTVEPATIQEEGVKEIDYYLNKKLVYVAKDAPYAYKLDTKHLLNGTYSLTAKTLYTTGRTSTSTQKVFVANAFSLEQAWLFIRHYLLVPVIVILAAVIVWRSFIHLRRMWWGGSDSSSGVTGGSSGPSLNNQPEPSVIRPSTMVSQAQTVEVTTEEGDG